MQEKGEYRMNPPNFLVNLREAHAIEIDHTYFIRWFCLDDYEYPEHCICLTAEVIDDEYVKHAWEYTYEEVNATYWDESKQTWVMPDGTKIRLYHVTELCPCDNEIKTN